MLAGLGAGAAGLLALTASGPGTPYWRLVLPMLAAGAGMALTMPAATTAVMEPAPAGRGGTAAASSTPPGRWAGRSASRWAGHWSAAGWGSFPGCAWRWPGAAGRSYSAASSPWLPWAGPPGGHQIAASAAAKPISPHCRAP